MPVVRVGSKHQVVIPKNVRDQLGVVPGDYVEISLRNNQAVIKRKDLVDDIPYTDESLGPKARVGLREAQQDVKAGRVHGPFKTAKEVQAHLNALKKNR